MCVINVVARVVNPAIKVGSVKVPTVANVNCLDLSKTKT
jgi:hypothetical protein